MASDVLGTKVIKRLKPDVLKQCFSRCGPGTSSRGIPRELVGNKTGLWMRRRLGAESRRFWCMLQFAKHFTERRNSGGSGLQTIKRESSLGKWEGAT